MMKRSDYIDYQVRVFDFMRSEGLTGLDAGERVDEFSSSRCEVCGGQLAGERYQVYGYKSNPLGGILAETYSGCNDCVYYAAYGKLDDTTMVDMVEDLPDWDAIRLSDDGETLYVNLYFKDGDGVTRRETLTEGLTDVEATKLVSLLKANK